MNTPAAHPLRATVCVSLPSFQRIRHPHAPLCTALTLACAPVLLCSCAPVLLCSCAPLLLCSSAAVLFGPYPTPTLPCPYPTRPFTVDNNTEEEETGEEGPADSASDVRCFALCLPEDGQMCRRIQTVADYVKVNHEVCGVLCVCVSRHTAGEMLWSCVAQSFSCMLRFLDMVVAIACVWLVGHYTRSLCVHSVGSARCVRACVRVFVCACVDAGGCALETG